MAQNASEIPAGSAFSVVMDIVNNFLAALRSSFSGSTAPASPIEGQLWYNTTTRAIGVWNGTAWIYRVTALQIPETTEAAAPTPAAGYRTLFWNTDDGALSVKDSSGTVTNI